LQFCCKATVIPRGASGGRPAADPDGGTVDPDGGTPEYDEEYHAARRDQSIEWLKRPEVSFGKTL
jgi:hypothetical protein